MKKFLLFSFISTFIFSQEEVSQDSLMIILDSLKINQQKMLENQQKILNEVKYIDPLVGKKYGLEINPIGLLFSSVRGGEGFTFRAGIAIFPDSLKGEINFPIYYRNYESSSEIEKVFQIDSQYRGFIGKHRKGFYFSSGLRYLSREREYKETVEGIISWISDSEYNKDHFGLTFGIGFRLYGKAGWYWGAGMYGGRYLTTDKPIFEIELLKFGMYF